VTSESPRDGLQTTLSRRQEAITLFALSALQFINIVDFMIVMALGPELLADLGINAQQFGWVASSYTLAAGVAGLAGATMLDGIGRRTAYVMLSIGLLLGTVGCGFADSYVTLLIARCVTGAFGGVHGAFSMAIVAELFPQERRGRATAILISSFAVASVVGVPLGLALGHAFGWQKPFLMLAALGTPFVLLAGWAMPRMADHLGEETHEPLAKLRHTLTVPAHRRGFLFIASLVFGTFAVVPYLSTSLVANVGVETASLPIVYVIGGLLTLAATPLTGRLVDHSGARQVFRVIAPLAAALLLASTLLPKVGLWGSVPVIAALMAVNSGRMVAAMSLIMESVDPKQLGGYMSVHSSVQHLGSGLGTLLSGLFLVGGDGVPLQHFGMVGVVASAVSLGSLWLGERVVPWNGAAEIRTRGSS
jgi:DHA1 family inner membrane transport protein